MILRDKQPVYKVVDDMFRSFVVNNRKLLNKMKDDRIKPLTFFPACQSYLQPFDVCYVGKTDGEEGPLYVFLSRMFDKLYTYYDVE